MFTNSRLACGRLLLTTFYNILNFRHPHQTDTHQWTENGSENLMS